MKNQQRIASLLPSSTEILFALGLGDCVVGVSHECDHPAAAHGLPVVTYSRVDSTRDSRTIDTQVRNLIQTGLSLYGIHEDLLASLKPDLIVTQDTCKVCAVSFEDVCRTVEARFGPRTRVVSLSPLRLDDVFADLRRVAEAAGVVASAIELNGRLLARLQSLRERVAGKTLFQNPERGGISSAERADQGARPSRVQKDTAQGAQRRDATLAAEKSPREGFESASKRPRVLALEWLDPPMVAGHWTPELIEIAGGDPVLGHRGKPTTSESWQRIAASEAEVLLLIPCGFKIEQTRRELAAFLARPEIQYLPAVRDKRVFVADGNAYFNRPGPRLIESAEIAAAAIHGLKFDWMTANDLQPVSG